ncbi:MAG: hypothetical protein CMH83_12600 [Nocardioides sp.]|nr:hypothetical protein [Nocardioides sp.]
MPRPSHRRALRAVVGVSAVALVATGLGPAAALAPEPWETELSFAADPGTVGAASDSPGTPSLCGTAGAPLDVEVPVSDVPDGIVTDVEVGISFSTGAWGGDAAVTLVAPDGMTSSPVFGRTGAATPTGCGSPNDLVGDYVFSDRAVADWWTSALSATPMPSGEFRAHSIGPTNEQVLLTPTFAAVDPNGTWVLRVTDSGGGDILTVTDAAVTITVDEPPVLNLSGPGNGARLPVRPTYTISSPDADVAGFTCAIDGGAGAPCTSPFVPAVEPGDHVLAVTALDAAGQTTTATRSFTLRDIACEQATKKLAKAKKANKKAVKALKKATKNLKALKKKDASKAKIKKAAKKVEKATKVKTSKGKALGKAKRGFTSAC